MKIFTIMVDEKGRAWVIDDRGHWVPLDLVALGIVASVEAGK